MAPQTSVCTVANLLQRMTSADKDFRFMATNDLMGELQRENIRWDDDSETKVTNQIISLLKDKNGEVQNLAVKCLGYLVARIKDDRKQLVIKSLCQMLKNESEQIRDIASIALKTIVIEVPINKRVIDIMNNDLSPNLLFAISNIKDINVQLESLDILTELINRIGSQLAHHDKLQRELINQLRSDRSAVRKRSMNALSNLLACCSDQLFNSTIECLFQELIMLLPQPMTKETEERFISNSSACTSAKTLLQSISTVIRTAGHRSNIEQLNQMLPVIHHFCRINDDELREYCLQTFEVYVRRCPVSISTSLADIINVCIESISHDPNYNYDEDNVDEDTMDTDAPDDGDDNESAEDYSDDDDLSWKVRRASAKCLEAIIMSRRELTNEFFDSIAPILISRFKEREETVRADIIQTFLALLKQTRHSTTTSKLTEMVPIITSKASYLLREKGVKTRQIVFQMFTEIIQILPDALAQHMACLIPGVICSLTDKNSTSNMKIDALVFIQELIKTHKSPTFYPHINVILPAVMNAISDPFYKISSEALSLLTHLVCVIRPPNHEPMPNYESVLPTIYEKTLERMSKTDVDIEIKERAVTCMGQIIANFGDKIRSDVALSMLLDKLNNETTRLTSVKALIKITNSPLPVMINSIFPKAFEILSTFLKKNSRPLKISTLILIENVARRYSSLLDDPSLILADVQNLISESDLYISQLALTMLTTIIQTVTETKKAFPAIISGKVLQEALNLIRSPLLQGSALQSMLKFFSTLVDTPASGLTHKMLLLQLLEPIYSGVLVHKQAYNSTAKAIASISVSKMPAALSTVQTLINDSKKFKNNDNIYTLILLSIGEIGKVTDLSLVEELIEVLLQAFNSMSEEVKSAGSYALGCVAVGNMNKFLPVILHEIEARNKRQYLILHSLREVISAGQLEQLDTVWNLLMKHCECQEEGTRNVVSECLGKLTLLQPTVLLNKLINHLKNDYANKPLARSTIVAAIKFTISDQPQEIDNLLRQCIGEFLQALRDQDLIVRRVALITFNSAAHNKPSLIIELLPTILPLLYEETRIKQELIREVEMGPFKHQVDDGLDSRKAAFECMYTLLDTCHIHLDIFEFLTHVENGLKDHYDIKMLTYLMLNRLAALCPSAVLQRMERLVYPIEEVCRSKPKENAVRQEHEKQDELKRSALRAFDALKSIPNADKHPVVVRFFDDVVQSDRKLSDLYSSIHCDTHSSSPNEHKMDLS